MSACAMPQERRRGEGDPWQRTRASGRCRRCRKAVKRYNPTLEERAEEIIQDHLDGNLRKEGAMERRGKRRRLIPKPSIIEEAVRRKFQKEGGK